MTSPVLWTPSELQIKNSQMTHFREVVNARYGLELHNYDDLYEWSISSGADFWSEMWKYGKIISHSESDTVVDDISKMPGARWFPGATLNYAENLLRFRDGKIAVQFIGEDKIVDKVKNGIIFSGSWSLWP